MTRYDLRRAWERVQRTGIGALVARLGLRSEGRVRQTWTAVQSPAENWWDIPQVRARWNRKISGDPNTGHREYIRNRYLSGSRGLVALSLGCGTGAKEAEWARMGIFSRIDGFDLSGPRVAAATRHAAELGFSHVLSFQEANVLHTNLQEEVYDLVLAEQSLHHMAPLDKVLRRIHGALKPGGLFVLDEFVGPTRFQWTDRQIEAVNGLLMVLPERFRRKWNGRLKRSTGRPGVLSMRWYDPSEAVQSAEILESLEAYFEVVEVKYYGGALLHLLFNGIAQNFLGDEPQVERAIRLCFEAEDLLMETREINSDFAVVVCRKPAGGSP